MKILHALALLGELQATPVWGGSVTWPQLEWFDSRTAYRWWNLLTEVETFCEIQASIISTVYPAFPLVDTREQSFLSSAVKTHWIHKVRWIPARKIFCCSKYSYWWKQLVSNTIWEKSEDDGKRGKGSYRSAAWERSSRCYQFPS